MTRSSKRAAVIATAAAAVVAVAGTALAYYAFTTSSSTATVTVPTLGSPVTGTVTATSASVSFSVSAPVAAPTPSGYRVDRTAPSAASNVCPSLSTGPGTCTDSSPVAGAQNNYSVYALLGTNWASLTPTTVSVAVPAAVAPPSTPDLAAASDSGASNTDDITNVTAPTFTGTAPAGATVKLLDGATQIGSQVLGAGVTSWSITSSALAQGSHAIAATATVGANTSAPSGSLALTVDTTVPTGSDIQTANGTTGGLIDANDQVKFTFSEAVDPASIATGWNGSSIGVTVTFRNSNAGAASQRISAATVTTGGATVNLVGQVGWTQSYLSGANNSTATVTGTMTISADKKTVTITLSAAPSNVAASAIVATSTLNWTPVTGPKDTAGNALTSVTPITEQGTADADF